jgi:hypothetical protein
MNKSAVHEACMKANNDQIQFITKLLFDLQNGSQNDAKSSAGDKHETTISNMQLEQEKLNKQLQIYVAHKAILSKINPSIVNSFVSAGGLISTNHGIIYISASIGKLSLPDIGNVMCISANSPLAMALKGLSIGDERMVLGKKYSIHQIS